MQDFWTSLRRVACAAPLLVLPFACASNAHADERIVALGGAVTEILYALGQEQKIAAVDSTSLFPAQALKDKPSVGYFRAVSAEGILSVQPTRVLAVDGAGPPAALDAVAQAGIPVTRIPDTPTVEGIAAKIAATGAAAGAQDGARRLADEVLARFGQLARARAAVVAPRRVLFVIALQNGRPLIGGKGTAGDAIVTLAGGASVATFDGYKPMADDAIVEAAPDAIVMMERAGGPAGGDVLSLPAIAATPAGKTHTLIAMDGLYLLGFGPRTPDAARDLMQALYPDLNVPRLRSSETAGR